ncbi:MAG: protein kinase [Desulfosalsimonadaceae bacterium]
MIDIPNYEIGKLAGRGGVAEVYLARHKLLDRKVAIKLISPTHADELADKRFLKEAKVVAGLRHPNIVSIYDVGVYENKYYIIMEYLEGGDLKQNIKRELSVEQALKIMRQIASALAHAHDKGFIHRDIKSQNIMFRGDGTAVLTDFGIVKDLAVDTGYTMDGTSIGTPHYMSPEQAQGTGGIDWRTDLYSLGVTFYEMLTGSVPYNADSPIAVALKHIQDPVPQLPEAFSRFQPIISRLMAKNPDDRYQSADELLRAIGKLDGEGAPTTTAFLLPGKFGRKVNLANVFFGVVIGCVLFGLVLFIQPYIAGFIDRQQTPAGKSQPAVQAKKRPILDAIKKKWTHTADTEQLMGRIEKKDYPEALDYITNARKELREPPNEMVQKADRFLESKQYLNAGDVYSSVLSADPGSQSALLGLLYVTVLKQQELSGNEKATVGEYDALLALLSKGIETTHSQSFEYLKMAAIESVLESADGQLARSRFKEAGKWSKTGLKYAPDHLRLKKLDYLIAARDAVNEDRLTSPERDNALSYYRKILEMDPDDPGAKQGISGIIDTCKDMAETARKEKNHAEALKWIEKARSVAPDDAELQISEWLITGDMHAFRGEFKTPASGNALQYYRKVLDQFPQNKQATMRIAAMDVMVPLYQVRQKGPLSEKIPAYRMLFSNLKSVIEEYGEAGMTDVKREVMDQVKEDIAAQKDRNKAIPADFLALVSGQFPDEKNMFSTQYDILIAKGDESAASKEKADYYLNALKLNPAAAVAQRKIEKVAKSLDDNGKPDEAQAILKQAMDIAPNHEPFNAMLQDIKRLQGIQAETAAPLSKIKQNQNIIEKIEPYTALFRAMNAAAKRYGSKKITSLVREVKAQVQADIQAEKANGRLIPDEFTALLKNHFPEMHKSAMTAQYDILIGKGDKGASNLEAADYYLKALNLDKNRAEAKNRIEVLIKDMDANGDASAAADLLGKAVQILPNELIFAQLSGKMESNVEVFATASGCGKENRITRAPVSIENLSICIYYKNMSPDSVVNIVLQQKGGKTMEAPLILDGRSGNKPIDIMAPIEGFAQGEYLLSVRQGGKILSETTIQLTPQRR